ncbi:DNA primase [Pseudofrancisella aestuarii]|uniref:DNA primase n=1 Tax=Pseudofrancisella aestuarii TaxID=2670347 RepID=A0ABV9TC83_9GAMM|nr:DNA primase [Pseudofrancisella aestuarii]
MAKKISTQFIKELVSSADIVDVVSRFVNLKKSGKSYKGCCPFHNEKTPSFFVNPSKGFFHCFGCHESGDALTFVKKINNLDFVNAVESLSDIVGRSVEYENFSEEDQQKEKIYNQCLSFLDISSKYYRWNLMNSNTKEKAIKYLKSRGIDGQIVNFFNIGYATDDWSGVCNFASKANVVVDTVIETGLAIKNDNGRVYDRFRSRIMFPIRNIQGRVIGYGGRVIDDVDGVKYINSPESIVFQKSSVLYGLYEYRQKRKEGNNFSSIVVVEGYMDVVGLAKYGFYEAVATLGTAFSPQHAKILFRETTSVVLCFDGDDAGKNAAIRTIKLILPVLDVNKKLKILVLPNNKDPDDYVKENGLDSFKEKLESALHVTDYLVKIFLGNKDIKRAENKLEVAESMKDFFSEVDANIYSESIIITIADKLGFSVEQLKQLVNNKEKKSYYQINGTRKQNLAKNVTLEQRVISELFANLDLFKKIINKREFDILPNSENLDILSKCLKILKDDSYINIEVVALIQMLTESYPEYREYFFELLGFGVESGSIKHNTEDYENEVESMLRRIEINSVKGRLIYLRQQPVLTEVEKMELKFLINRLR